MKNILLHILIILFIIPCLNAQDDIRLSLDSTTFLIGDQTELIITYETTSPPSEWQVMYESIDTMHQIEFLGKGPVIRTEENNAKLIEQNLRVAFFDTGTIWIPAIPVVIESKLGRDTLETNEIPIRVLSPQVDSLSMAPIKDIIREPWHITDAWPYLLALIIAALLYLSLRRSRRRKKRAVLDIPPEEEVVHSPFENAMQAIELMKTYNTLDPQQLKEYYAEFSMIVRLYLEEQFSFPAAESITSEIEQDMHRKDIPRTHIDQVIEILRISDMVKFAKIIPAEDQTKHLKPVVIQNIKALYEWHKSQVSPEEEQDLATQKVEADELLADKEESADDNKQKEE